MSSEKKDGEVTKGNLVKMSCFDSKFSHLENISSYFYNGILNDDVLNISLNETVKTIPLLSSVMVNMEEEDDHSLHFRLVRPSNVKIYRKEISNDEDYIYYLGEPKENGIIPFEECKELNHHIEHVRIPQKPEEMPCITNTPLLVITHLVLVNTKRSILVVATSHSLVDLLSHIQFLRSWEYFYNEIIDSNDPSMEINRLDGENYPFKIQSFDRSPLFRSEDFHDTPPSRFSLEKYVHNIPSTTEKKNKKKREFFVKEVLFSYDKIMELKKFALETVSEEFKNEYSEEYFHFSSLDVVSAFIWKLFCPIIFDDDCDTTMENVFPIQVHINFRNRFRGIDDTFFGNAVHTANTVLTRKEVIETKFGNIVFLIRKMIKEYNEEDVRRVIDGMSRDKKKKRYDWNNGIYMNDWRLLRKVVPKFKHVSCERYVMVPSVDVKPGFRFYIHDHPKGVAVFMPIERSLYQNTFKDLELTSLETIDKLYSAVKMKK